MAALRIGFGFLVAAGVALAFASAFHTQMVIAGLEAAGAVIPYQQRLSMTAGDFAGLAPQFGAVIGIGLAIGFLVAAGLRRILKPLAPIAYPLAGAAAVGTALFLMSLAFDGTMPLAGARTATGFALQCLAGAFGGLAFSIIAVRRR